jgi:hypothetical protein
MEARMRKGVMAALLAGAGLALGGCSKEETTDQNVAIDINDADPSDIEAVPADETADGTEEPADANTDTNAN